MFTFIYLPISSMTETWKTFTNTLHIYQCDFAKRCPLSFRLNTGIVRVQASAAGTKPRGLGVVLGVSRELAQAQTYPWVGSFLVLCENQGVWRGGFVSFIRVLCQKAVQSQRIFPVA